MFTFLPAVFNYPIASTFWASHGFIIGHLICDVPLFISVWVYSVLDMERYVVRITEGLFLEIFVSGGTVKASVLKETGKETEEGKLIEKLRAYISGVGDVDIRIEDLDLSGYRREVIDVYRTLKKNVTFGESITYAEMGELVGRHPRFVAYCMKINRFPVIIPCHRVIARDGIGGFSYGLEIKRKLLSFEGVFRR